MPKVNEEHFEKKKLEILEAAKRVCAKKPIYNVAMRDIVIEAGLSQGGVYKYFSNIDEVFVALLNENTLSMTMMKEIDEIVSANADSLIVLENFLKYIGAYINETVSGNGKILVELMSLYSNEPERFEKIKDHLNEVSALIYIKGKLAEFLQRNCDNGNFKPIIPLSEITLYIVTVLNGIISEKIAASKHKTVEMAGVDETEILLRALYLSLSHLLGIKRNSSC